MIDVEEIKKVYCSNCKLNGVIPNYICLDYFHIDYSMNGGSEYTIANCYLKSEKEAKE